MNFLAIILAFVALIALLAFLPSLLGLVLDPLAKRRIMAHCTKHGLADVEVKVFPNHYGVSFVKNGQRHYARCRVILGKMRWKGPPPEEIQ